jgi:hypothetical protein
MQAEAMAMLKQKGAGSVLASDISANEAIVAKKLAKKGLTPSALDYHGGGATQNVLEAQKEMRAVADAVASCALPGAGRALLGVACSVAERTALTRRMARLETQV